MEMFSRYNAAEILRQLAEYGEHGSYPQKIDPETAGIAVARMMLNCNDPEWYKLFCRGFADYSARMR